MKIGLITTFGAIFSSLLSEVAFSASCSGSTWAPAYSSQNCDYSGGQYTVKCDKSNCGTRLDGSPRLGQGTYKATIKAAPGVGTNTAFYLYSYGRNNDQSSGWNEIDIEILGQQISNGQTRLWTNFWSGFGNQHGQYITLNFDASAGFHTYEIQIDSSNIIWRIDGTVRRTESYTGYSDIVSTVNNKNFQGEMVLWGGDGSWGDMGSIWSNSNSFPIYAYFKSASLSVCSSCGSSSGGSSSGSSTKLVIANQDGSNQWWYAVTISNLPTGVSITKVQARPNGGNWETGVKEWQYYKFTTQAPYNPPIDFRVTTSTGQTVESLDLINGVYYGSSGTMSTAVNSAYTAEDETDTTVEWPAIFGIIVAVLGCIALVAICAYCCRQNRSGKASTQGTTGNAATATTVTDGEKVNETNKGYDMSPIDTTKNNDDEQEIEVDMEVEMR